MSAAVGRTGMLGDRYRLDHVLGRGGMGAVWAGHDTVLDRPVAVKMLRDDFGTDAPLQRQRLVAEARAAAAVRHPNLVSMLDAVSDEGMFALVMERLPGPSLADRLTEGPLTTAEVRVLASDVLSGLQAVHDAGLVHRDVKPANVLLTADGRWKLVDFGVAKNLLAEEHLTVTGTTVGTPAYLAPEQFHGQPASASVDLWAVGVMLYQALTGRLPFPGDTPFAIAYAAQVTEPEPLSGLVPDADPSVVGTIERALQKFPHHRFPSASAMAASLVTPATGQVGEALSSPRRSPAVALVIASLLVVIMLAVTLGDGLEGSGTTRVTPTTAATTAADDDGPSSSAPPSSGDAAGETPSTAAVELPASSTTTVAGPAPPATTPSSPGPAPAAPDKDKDKPKKGPAGTGSPPKDPLKKD